jgi:NAD+ kinase
MKVAIYSRGLDLEQEIPLITLLEELAKHKVSVLLYSVMLKQFNIPTPLLENVTPFDGYEDLTKEIEYFITLGGDGTILDATTIVREKDIPLLGINFGRLGFLANISRDELVLAVDAIINRTFIADRRSLIHVDASVPLFGNSPFALNEFAIHKRDTAPMIKIHTYLNGEFLNTFWADGLIVATPTGSTGYSMSCTGPIVFPDSKNFVITPVAPHNLNVRSIVVADTSIISFEIESRADQFICALDARREIVDRNVQLAVKKEVFEANLIKLSENTFLSTLRDKLTWGMDIRN